ncbi:MAG: hypothetical protein L3K17_04705 [Thermoplasmata archaeon]|nr:hypothetical protein [Thermoplasmata archaeon]
MSLPAGPRPPRTGGAADEEYADAYAEGYAEGLREALREMLQHAARGHTAHELRFLIESRLARLKEDVELKRRSLLAPPKRTTAYTPMFRSAPSATPVPALAPLGKGDAGVVFEESPERSLAVLALSAPAFPRVVVIGFHRPALPGIPESKVTFLSVADAQSPEASRPESILGQVAEAMGAREGALVYCDALEALATTIRVDGTLKFVQWLAAEAGRTGSALLVSVGPRSFSEQERSTLRRLFGRQL